MRPIGFFDCGEIPTEQDLAQSSSLHPFLNRIADRPNGGERVYKGAYSGRSKWKFRLMAQFNGRSLMAPV